MKKITKKTSNIILFSCLVILISTGLATVLLLPIPFGLFFNIVFYAFLTSLLIIIAYLCFRLFKSKKRWVRISGILTSTISLCISLLIIITLIDIRILVHQGLPPSPTGEEWIEDVDYLAEKMETMHPGLFSMVSRDEFYQARDELKKNIPNLRETQIMAGIYKLVALPNDAHTFPNIFSVDLDWHLYPFELYCFEDGLYVTNTGRRHKKLIGHRLVKIETTSADDLYDQMSKFLGSENEYGKMNRSGLVISEWLMGEGIIDHPKKVSFTFQDDTGKIETIQSDPVHYLRYFYWTMMKKVDNPISPAIPNDRKDNYWFEYQANTKTLYFQFNQTIIQKNRPIPEFVSEFTEAVSKHDIDRCVIDIRNNGGGDYIGIIPPLVEMISENQKINQHGKLFVILSRRTFSGGVVFANYLRQKTRAVFVGEPSSQGPNFYATPQPVVLPNSKTNVMISTFSLQSGFENDPRIAMHPDIHTEYTYDDFHEDRDPAMEAILNYQTASELTPTNTIINPATYTGRYKLSPYQVLEVDQRNEHLAFKISDFYELSFFHIHSFLDSDEKDSFTTTIPGVELSFDRNSDGLIDSLRLNWMGIKKELPLLPADYRFPMEYWSEGQLDKAMAGIRDDKNTYQKKFIQFELLLNAKGYEYLNLPDVASAIKVFELLVELFPDYANGYDSLAEAYLNNGDKDKSIAFYKKAYEMDPNNTNARVK
ncbi:MAG: tetratricopeptide repeat protein, partial [Bacteroidetes bacterium]|nr:tetratricopeptide repeat protein [Bacteroidota bacterium]